MSDSRHLRLRIGPIWIDAVTFDQALERILALVELGQGGSVFTPNVDHVVSADRQPALREAYADASLSLVDGQPLVWASRLLGHALPEKISGSDLVPRLLDRAIERRLRVYLLGGAAGVVEEADRLLRGQGVNVVGFDGALIPQDPMPTAEDQVVQRIRTARPDLLLVALGTPKQEIWIHRVRVLVRPAVCLGIGASLDFLTGRIRRAPPWMQRAGLEWFYRLIHEPRRLYWRYLVNDPRIVLVVARTLRLPRAERVVTARLPRS